MRVGEWEALCSGRGGVHLCNICTVPQLKILVCQRKGSYLTNYN